MELCAATSSVNRTDHKQKARLDLQGHRFGTPKLRDLLREKCRIRVRQSRQSLFDNKRQLSCVEEEPEMLKNILRTELKEMEIDVELQEKLLKEFIGDVNQWLAEQYDYEYEYLRKIVEEPSVTCPLCQKNFLQMKSEMISFGKKSFTYTCSCNARFLYTKDLDGLQIELAKLIDGHELHCENALNFYVNPLTQKLEAICDNCDYFGAI